MDARIIALVDSIENAFNGIQSRRISMVFAGGEFTAVLNELARRRKTRARS
ncbi:MAG: hypothetical protein ACRC8Q_06015 [Aeromonas sp.]